MCTFSDFLHWCNKKDVAPTLRTLQKMVDFYHKKGIDMLEFGCTLPNLANIWLHQSTTEKCYAFIESDRNLVEKLREDMIEGPSLVFTRAGEVEKIFIRVSTN